MRDPYHSPRTIPGAFGCGENCACGGRCGCRQAGAGRLAGDGGTIRGPVYQKGFGAGDAPRTTAALIEYIEGEIAAGRPFYISPEVNSDAYKREYMMGAGGGFWKRVRAVAGRIRRTLERVIPGGRNGGTSIIAPPAMEFDPYRTRQLGGVDGFWSSVFNVGKSVASAAAKAAPSVATAAGTYASVKQAQAASAAAKGANASANLGKKEQKIADAVAASLAAQGINLPAAATPQIVGAAAADNSAMTSQNLLLIGGAVLAAVLLTR